MGTGNDFGGPSSHSQLLPDFLSADPDKAEPVIDGIDDAVPEEDRKPLEPRVIVSDDDIAPDDARNVPARSQPPIGPILDNARRAFTDYAVSRETSALRRSFSNYVRDGLGGTRNAGARMGRSSAAANSVSAFLRDVQTRGIDRVLRELHLDELVGHTASEVFAGVIDVICPNVESIDDALAREALLDTVLEFNEMGVADIAALSELQMKDFFQRFICNAILRRFLADVSLRGNGKAASDFSYQTLESDIRDFIGGAVEVRIGQELDRGGPLDPRFTAATVETIFEAAWSVLEAMDRE